MRVWTIVVAAGSGRRFGDRKQYLLLDGRRVVDRAVDPAVEAAQRYAGGVVVVLPPGEAWDGPPVRAAVPGGATRAESVRAGLAAVPTDADIVVVHDAARPLATGAVFEAVIHAVAAGAAGAVPGVPVVDTIKRVEAGAVVETVPRDDLVAVQTPQAFRAEVLRAAHEDGGDAPDDAALVEESGATVVVVPGDPHNLKVTTPDDLVVAAALLAARSERSHL